MAEERGGGGLTGGAGGSSLGKRRAADTDAGPDSAAERGDDNTNTGGARERDADSLSSEAQQDSAGAATSQGGPEGATTPAAVDVWRFRPSVKIRRIDDSILINTIVVKEQALTSALFAILEQDGLDIVYENQYRTETKVAHTILVKLSPGYDVDALRRRLCQWAGANPAE